MRRWVILFAAVLVLGLAAGCGPDTGEMTISGTMVQTAAGQSVLAADEGIYLLLEEAPGSGVGEQLAGYDTGDRVVITVAAVPFTAHEGYEATRVYAVRRLWFQQETVDDAVVSEIETLLANS